MKTLRNFLLSDGFIFIFNVIGTAIWMTNFGNTENFYCLLFALFNFAVTCIYFIKIVDKLK